MHSGTEQKPPVRIKLCQEIKSIDIFLSENIIPAVWWFLLGSDVGGDGHPRLRTEVGLVGSDGFAIVAVDVLLEEPVPLHLA